MREVRESDIKKAVKKRLAELGAFQHWPVQMGMGAPTLDCVGCYESKFFAIETKAPGKRITALQGITIDKIKLAGGKVLVIDSIAQATTFVL